METIFITKIIKVGDSHGVIIPVNILNAYHWQRGDIVIFGFAADQVLFLKRPSDIELQKIKPDATIKLS